MEEMISVLVPVYNVEKYLKECLDSLLVQTYKNFEIILVDDGSTDKSGIICDDYAKLDLRIKVIHQKNGGLGNARNTALKVAQGQYIAIADSDDWVDKDILSAMNLAMKESDADIVVGGHYIVNFDGSLEKVLHVDESRVLDHIEATSLILEDKVMHSYAWGKMYKRKLFEGISYPENYSIEDIFTTYKLVNKSEKILFFNKAYYYYRRRESSLLFNPDPVNVFNKKVSYFRAFYERFIFVSLRPEFVSIKNVCQEKAFDQGQQLMHFIIRNKLDKKSSSFYEILNDLSLMDISQNPLVTVLRKAEHKVMRLSPGAYILLVRIFFILKKVISSPMLV